MVHAHEIGLLFFGDVYNSLTNDDKLDRRVWILHFGDVFIIDTVDTAFSTNALLDVNFLHP